MKRLMAAAALLAAAPAGAQTADGYPKRVPTPGGEVLIPSAGAQRAYDDWHYAPARRAGDFLYISGVVVGRAPTEGRDAEAFKTQTRRAFQNLERTLKAAGLRFADVVMINSFHVWQSPDFAGTKDEHFAAFASVKDEFMQAPHPAWTAVGTTGLLPPNGIVEIQMIAYAPKR